MYENETVIDKKKTKITYTQLNYDCIRTLHNLCMCDFG